MAVSTDSEPEPVRKTRASSIGASVRSRAANRSLGSFVNGSKQWYAARVRIWAAAASAISLRPWPTLAYQRLPMPST